MLYPRLLRSFTRRTCTHFIPGEFTGKKDPRYVGNGTRIYIQMHKQEEHMESKGAQNTSLKIHFQIISKPRTIFTENSDNSTDYLVNMGNAALRNSQSQKKINFWFILTAWLCLQSRVIRTEPVGVAHAQGCARALGDAAALHAAARGVPQVARDVGASGVAVPHGRGPGGFVSKNHASHIAGVHTFLLVGFLLFPGTTGNVAHSALTSG